MNKRRVFGIVQYPNTFVVHLCAKSLKVRVDMSSLVVIIDFELGWFWGGALWRHFCCLGSATHADFSDVP